MGKDRESEPIRISPLFPVRFEVSFESREMQAPPTTRRPVYILRVDNFDRAGSLSVFPDISEGDQT